MSLDETGGSYVTRSMREVLKYVESGKSAAFTIPSDVYRVDIDAYAQKNKQKVLLATKNTPKTYLKSEVFKRDNLPENYSTCFDGFSVEEIECSVSDGIVNIYLAGERTYQTNHYAETSKGFSFKAKKETAYDGREIYVMVVGETARACEFSIYGYNRPTTPLMQRERGLVAFSNVMSQSNTTHKSVPMLLSAASATDYDRIYREKGIIEAFKEAGFDSTTFKRLYADLYKDFTKPVSSRRFSVSC